MREIFRSLTAAAAWACVAGAPIAAAQPPIIKAVRAGDAETVRALVAEGADVNAAYGDGATALHWAVDRDDAALVGLLLSAGARAGAADDLGVTPLALACQNGNARLAKVLLDNRADPNAARESGETPLMTAARVGAVDVIKLLLANGADIDAMENFRGQTALMLAVVENHAPAVAGLIAAGASVTARTKNRFTPLLFAAQQGNVEIARLLLASGADANESAPDGIGGDTNARAFFKADTEATALLVAIDSGHERMASFLLEQGADVNRDGAGRTALHSAVQRAMPELARNLIARGANLDARLARPMPLLSRMIRQDTGVETNPIGATPFWLAASYCDTRIMRILAAAGANTVLTSQDGTTPLMVAAGVDFVDGQDKYGRRSYLVSTLPFQEAARDAVALGLELGGDINAVNDKGQTALHGAVYLGGTLLVQFLVDHGAKLDVVNKRGQTPWLITQGEYFSGSFFVHKETGELLAKLGADMTLGKDLGREWGRRRGDSAEPQ